MGRRESASFGSGPTRAPKRRQPTLASGCSASKLSCGVSRRLFRDGVASTGCGDMAGKGNQDAEILREFVMESRETLARVEPLINELDVGTEPSSDELAVLFRCFHSFKGTASFLELRQTAAVAHGAESLLELLRRGAPIELEHVQLLRRVLTTFSANLDVIESGATDEARSIECLEITSALGAAVATIRAAGVIPISSLKRPTLDLVGARGESPARGAAAHNRRVPMAFAATSPAGDGLVPPASSKRQVGPSPLPERVVANPTSRGALSRVDDGSNVQVSEDPVCGGQRMGGSVCVDIVELDTLLELAEKLATAQLAVTNNPDLVGHDFENFRGAALRLGRVTHALLDKVVAVSRVPIEPTLRKLDRLVRNVASQQQKQALFVTSGERTVDTVVERMSDPIARLVRSAVDHGIEFPEERTRSGKSPAGTVGLDVRHREGEVWITVRDDGRGLDAQQILARAVERGLADPSRRYSERETYDFIFAAGFSVASRLTESPDLATGLDVVRRTIEAANGRIDVASELGQGTVFTLRVPLTVAIVDGMLVRGGGASDRQRD